jgi:hypothetical protein
VTAPQLAAGAASVEAHPAGAHQAAPEAAAAQRGGQVQGVAAQAPAPRGGGQEAHVAGQSTQVPDVVGHALQLQGDAADGQDARRQAAAGQGFQGLAIGRGLTDSGVPGQGFRQVQAAQVGPADRRATPRCW